MQQRMCLFVYLPEASHRLPKHQKVPLLIWVDQSDAQIDVTVQSSLSDQTVIDEFRDSYGLFSHLIWIEGLDTPGDRILQIQASKPGFVTCCTSCTLHRDPLGNDYGTEPHINYPGTGPVPPNFAASGTVDPAETPCTAWLVDGNNNTYPGMSIPCAPGNWSFGFQNIPVGKYTLYVRASTGDTANEAVTVQAGP